MNPREAERLLGGYATGTLTEAERKALFAAALEDQSLFDALADEEGLRELLADPAARARLLAALESPAPRVRPLWRRPGAMTLAASLVAAVGVGILLKHVKTPEAQEAPGHAAPKLESAPSALPAQPLQARPSEPPAREAMRMKKAAPASPRQSPAPPPPPAPQGGAGVADVAAEAKQEPAADQAAAPAPKAEKAPDAAATGFFYSTRSILKVSVPVWAWEGSGADRRLSVAWGPGGALTLIARESGGDRVIAPLSVATLPDGRTRSLFSTPESATPLDLLWTADAAANGFRARVWPEKK